MSARVKILHRTPKLAPLPNFETPLDPDKSKGFVTALGSFFPHRKSSYDRPLTLTERISEFIHFKKPNINMNEIAPLVQRLKVPGLVLIGVAFIAGLSYMAYKLYSNWSDKKANETVDSIMIDFTETTPELLQLPGWYDKVRNEVFDAVNSKDDVYMVEQIAKIKTSLIEKQQSMGHAVGSGIDLFVCANKSKKKGGRCGRGVIMPL